jgi:hypothetical protein
MHIRIVDFGFSRGFAKLNPLMNTTCGSPPYMSPEIVREESYTAASDVWSAGVLLYAMVVGTFPFRAANLAQLIQQICTAAPAIPAHLSSGLRALLLRLLNKDPRARISVAAVLEDPWLLDGAESLIRAHASGTLAALEVTDVPALDEGVLAEMRALGFETPGIDGEVRAAVLNGRTAVYIMLKRARTTDGIARLQEAPVVQRFAICDTPVRDSLPALVQAARPSRESAKHARMKLRRRQISRSAMLPTVVTLGVLPL